MRCFCPCLWFYFDRAKGIVAFSGLRGPISKDVESKHLASGSNRADSVAVSKINCGVLVGWLGGDGIPFSTPHSSSPGGRHTVRPMLTPDMGPPSQLAVLVPQNFMLIHTWGETLCLDLGRFTGIKQLIM